MSKYYSYIFYADRNVRPWTIPGYTLTTFTKVTQYIYLCTTQEEIRTLAQLQEKGLCMKERFRSSLNSSRCRWAKLLQELNELSKGIEATTDRKLHKETETRMGILQTTLSKVETSIDESEDHLEESRMREEDAYQVDQGQSNSNTDEDGDVIVEGAQKSACSALLIHKTRGPVYKSWALGILARLAHSPGWVRCSSVRCDGLGTQFPTGKMSTSRA